MPGIDQVKRDSLKEIDEAFLTSQKLSGPDTPH
jgi:hypothetical protein